MMVDSKLPNFFIIGAPKCGTTSMSQYLGAHPQVFMSFPKEPNFLADDLQGLHAVHSMLDYLKLFQASTDQHIAIGEASVWYLYSEAALANIRKLNSAAKIIVMFRHPVDFLESYHAHMLFSLVEDVHDLEKAWSLQKLRAEGEYIPDTCRAPMLLQYDRVSRFGECMENVFQLFPPEQVKCVFLEDFRNNARGTYLDVLHFLNLDDDGRTEFLPANERKVHHSKYLAHLMMAPPPLLRSLWYGLKRMFGPDIIRLANQMFVLNSVATGHISVSPSFRRHLTSVLKDDMIRLEGLIGQNSRECYSTIDTLNRAGDPPS